MNSGHLNPLTQIEREVVKIFANLGFTVIDGPEIENEWYNFEALNMPPDHPSRDMQDTFYLNDGNLLRTQTSAVQVRYMEKHKPPFKIICPGRVFRRDASDATHMPQFYQIEGMMVGKDVSMADLEGTLSAFLKEYFKASKIRFRPSFFPYVKPGMEVDIECSICKGKGCPTCKRTGWVEILGAGMIHQKVFESAKLNPEEWQGFAFGVGMDRLAMMKFQIDDIRLLYSGDLRFLKQF